MVRERQKFLTRSRVASEQPADRARDGFGVLLLDPAHHHAQVVGFDHDANSLGLKDFVDGARDLLGQPLLNLQPAREDLRPVGAFGICYTFLL